jgi:hypothetical protein
MQWLRVRINKEWASEIVRSFGYNLNHVRHYANVYLDEHLMLTMFEENYNLSVPVSYRSELENVLTTSEFRHVFETDDPPEWGESRIQKLEENRQKKTKSKKRHKEEEPKKPKKPKYELCRFCWERPPITDDGRCERCLNAKEDDGTVDDRSLSRKWTEHIGRKARSTQILGGVCELDPHDEGEQ